jgi:F-type H+-transporting ATPase subunit b
MTLCRRILLLALFATLACALPLYAAEQAPPAGDTPAAPEHEAAAEQEPNLLPTPAQGLFTGVTTLIVFSLLLAILGKYAWGPIARGLHEREANIRKDISDAQASRNAAEQKLAEYQKKLASAEDEVRALLDKARVDAEKMATMLKMQAQQDSEEIKERATREIEASKNQALSEIYAQSADLSTKIAEKILRRNLNADDQRDLVKQSLEEFQTAGRN